MLSPFLVLVHAELCRARHTFPVGIHSGHEGYGVIMEEVAEFFEEVRAQTLNPGAMLKELVQIAAMCQRVAEDVLLLQKG